MYADLILAEYYYALLVKKGLIQKVNLIRSYFKGINNKNMSLKGEDCMPWNKRNYPVSMKNLEPRVREKAVEIANALLEEGNEEGKAIAIATAKAKEWNEDHPPREKGQESSINLHVVPEGDGWVVKEEGVDKIRFSADTKTEAVDKSKEWASDTNASVFVHRKDGTVETTHNYS